MVSGTGHAGSPRMQEAVRIRGGSTNQEAHADISSLYETMGRGGTQGVYEVVETEGRQER